MSEDIKQELEELISSFKATISEMSQQWFDADPLERAELEADSWVKQIDSFSQVVSEAEAELKSL